MVIVRQHLKIGCIMFWCMPLCVCHSTRGVDNTVPGELIYTILAGWKLVLCVFDGSMSVKRPSQHIMPPSLHHLTWCDVTVDLSQVCDGSRCHISLLPDS